MTHCRHVLHAVDTDFDAHAPDAVARTVHKDPKIILDCIIDNAKLQAEIQAAEDKGYMKDWVQWGDMAKARKKKCEGTKSSKRHRASSRLSSSASLSSSSAPSHLESSDDGDDNDEEGEGIDDDANEDDDDVDDNTDDDDDDATEANSFLASLLDPDNPDPLSRRAWQCRGCGELLYDQEGASECDFCKIFCVCKLCVQTMRAHEATARNDVDHFNKQLAADRVETGCVDDTEFTSE